MAPAERWVQWASEALPPDVDDFYEQGLVFGGVWQPFAELPASSVQIQPDSHLTRCQACRAVLGAAVAHLEQVDGGRCQFCSTRNNSEPSHVDLEGQDSIDLPSKDDSVIEFCEQIPISSSSMGDPLYAATVLVLDDSVPISKTQFASDMKKWAELLTHTCRSSLAVVILPRQGTLPLVLDVQLAQSTGLVVLCAIDIGKCTKTATARQKLFTNRPDQLMNKVADQLLIDSHRAQTPTKTHSVAALAAGVEFATELLIAMPVESKDAVPTFQRRVIVVSELLADLTLEDQVSSPSVSPHVDEDRRLLRCGERATSVRTSIDFLALQAWESHVAGFLQSLLRKVAQSSQGGVLHQMVHGHEEFGQSLNYISRRLCGVDGRVSLSCSANVKPRVDFRDLRKVHSSDTARDKVPRLSFGLPSVIQSEFLNLVFDLGPAKAREARLIQLEASWKQRDDRYITKTTRVFTKRVIESSNWFEGLNVSVTASLLEGRYNSLMASSSSKAASLWLNAQLAKLSAPGRSLKTKLVTTVLLVENSLKMPWFEVVEGGIVGHPAERIDPTVILFSDMSVAAGLPRSKVGPWASILQNFEYGSVEEYKFSTLAQKFQEKRQRSPGTSSAPPPVSTASEVQPLLSGPSTYDGCIVDGESHVLLWTRKPIEQLPVTILETLVQREVPTRLSVLDSNPIPMRMRLKRHDEVDSSSAQQRLGSLNRRITSFFNVITREFAFFGGEDDEL